MIWRYSDPTVEAFGPWLSTAAGKLTSVDAPATAYDHSRAMFLLTVVDTRSGRRVRSSESRTRSLVCPSLLATCALAVLVEVTFSGPSTRSATTVKGTVATVRAGIEPVKVTVKPDTTRPDVGLGRVSVVEVVLGGSWPPVV